MSNSSDRCKTAKVERQKYVDAILLSKSNKKIAVGGPGTGKTYLFTEILKKKNRSLTLTFVNSLVEDLSLVLCGLSEVRTLHSFARSLVGRTTKDVKIYPKLSEVIKEDAKILLKQVVDFDKLFHDKEIENKNIAFYSKRRNYYDNHYGFSDVIFAAIKYLEKYPEKIPTYDQILVDEFQDFNLLEVSLVDLLARKSPILLVGDDDQALYASLKGASAKYLRRRHGNERSDYASFDLPYCSRCTRVIVEAVKDIVDAASKNNFLKNRIQKPFKYFEKEESNKISAENPEIVHSHQYANQIPYFIQSQIGIIAKNLRSNFSVLIISPTRTQSRLLAKGLSDWGLKNIEYIDERSEKAPTLLDGLKILLEDGKSNLGWRIVSKFLLKENDFNSLLKETDMKNAKNLHEFIEKETKAGVKKTLKTLREIKTTKSINEEAMGEVYDMIDFSPYEETRPLIKKKLIPHHEKKDNAAIRKIPIKMTTIQGSKGLDAEFVFISHFDDRYFISNKNKENISNYDICKFIVALTRARKKVFLISSLENEPALLKWIKKERIKRI